MPKTIKSVLISALILVAFFIQPAFAFFAPNQPPGFILPQAYNVYGQVLSVAGPNGNVTGYEYASATGYLTKAIQAAGALDLATEMSYDPTGNLKSLKDPKGNTTSFEYDSHNT